MNSAPQIQQSTAMVGFDSSREGWTNHSSPPTLTARPEVTKVIPGNTQRCRSTFALGQKLLNRFAQDNTSVHISK